MKILAIETSCDETSLSIIEDNYIVLGLQTNTQIDTFKNYGGVIPELSSRLHEQNIYYLYDKIFEETKLTISDIDYIAVTYGPGLSGSLICGVNFAKTLSTIHNIPIIPVNHMQAHISALSIEYDVTYPFICLVVSGGHTELVLCHSSSNFEIIGQTLDDACGESFDKVARILKLGYPGGPEIDKLAKKGKRSYELPFALDDDSLNFSYSGLKSACFNLANSLNMKNIEININDFAFSFQYSAIEILIKKLKKACEIYNISKVGVVGGVSANSYLQKRVNEEFTEVMIPSLTYCTDNAAMIGAHALNIIDSAQEYVVDLDVNHNLKVTENYKI